MSGRVERRDPHLAVKREVLVRYLDVWTTVALRSQRVATFVESGCADFVADAFRVFGEFADRLDGRHLEMVLVGSAGSGEPPSGVSVRSCADPADVVVAGPALVHLDVVDGALAEADAWRLVASLGRGKAREALLTFPAAARLTDYCERLAAVGLSCTATVELVAGDGAAQLLVFATGDSKRLATFKNELWAVDEFAEIRYRDPHDPDHGLVDISLTPQLLPLRRELLAELTRQGRRTVADLQRHTLLQTIYRPADTIGALTSAAAAGVVTRVPEKGRLTASTVIGSP
jgi:hypothetical protein